MTSQTTTFVGLPYEVANLLYDRTVDDGRLSPPPGGWPDKGYVDGLIRAVDDVQDTHASDWTATFINNNHSQAGEQVAGYFQQNNSGGWGAALVAQSTGLAGSGTTVTAEFDSANAAVNLNLQATGGDTGAAIRVDAWSGAHITAGLEFNAHPDADIVVHGAGPHWLLYDPELSAGIALVGTNPQDAHFVAVAGGHAAQIV